MTLSHSSQDATPLEAQEQLSDLLFEGFLTLQKVVL